MLKPDRNPVQLTYHFAFRKYAFYKRVGAEGAIP